MLTPAVARNLQFKVKQSTAHSMCVLCRQTKAPSVVMHVKWNRGVAHELPLPENPPTDNDQENLEPPSIGLTRKIITVNDNPLFTARGAENSNEQGER